MNIKEKLEAILNDNGTVIYRGSLSSGDDINNHWYEMYDINFYDKSSVDCNKYWLKTFEDNFKDTTVEFWSYFYVSTIQIKNSVKIQRKEKLKMLNRL